MTGHVRDSSIFSRQVVLDLVDGIVLAVHGADEHVVGDVVQVAAELQPRSGSTDVVCGAFAFHLWRQRGVTTVLFLNTATSLKIKSNGETDLDENVHVLQIVAAPFVKGLQQLETVALRADVHLELGAVRWWVLVGVLARVEVSER